MDTFCGHFLWTLFVDTFCGHLLWVFCLFFYPHPKKNIKKNILSFFKIWVRFCINATNRIGREIQCLPYAGFLICPPLTSGRSLALALLPPAEEIEASQCNHSSFSPLVSLCLDKTDPDYKILDACFPTTLAGLGHDRGLVQDL